MNGSEIHWQLKAGAAKAVCGANLAGGLIPTLLADIATCEKCKIAALGYRIGRVDERANSIEQSNGPKACVKCGHFDETDPRGRCISVYYDAGGSLCYCGCKCEFTASPAALRDEAVSVNVDVDEQGEIVFGPTTPPSTLAKAAAEEIVAELDRRAWLFDSHGARPIASGKAAYMEQVVAAIIERCLAGGE